MYLRTLTLIALIAPTLSSPAPNPTPPAKLEDRQTDNLPQLLSLASLAGITAFPTDPAVLFQLAPLATKLAAALPTAPVLSALETAAPSGFVSQIVHDPSYASSFESAFSAGHSPSWFTALPKSVKSYLHTYTGFAGIATAAAELNSVTRNLTSAASQTGMSTTGGMSTAMSTTSDAQAAAQSSASSSSSKAGAAKPTGMIGVGIAGVVGVLGVAAVL